MDATDRKIVNALQGGFPVSERPYAEAATKLGIGEDDLIRRLDTLLSDGTLTRFGPMYHAERLGGGLTLAAMRLPPQEFERVAETVDTFTEAAQNLRRTQ